MEKKTDNLNKAHGSRHLTLRKGQHFHKLDTLTDEATSLWHSCMTWERQTLSWKKMKMTTLTWQHYVQNACKNVINMSKNHRHYVHLCTGARAGLLCLLRFWGRKKKESGAGVQQKQTCHQRARVLFLGVICERGWSWTEASKGLRLVFKMISDTCGFVALWWCQSLVCGQ